MCAPTADRQKKSCTTWSACSAVVSELSTSPCRSRRRIMPTMARAVSPIRAASYLQQSECPPQRNTRTQGQQGNDAVGDGRWPRLAMGEQAAVGALIQRQIGRALVRQEESVAGDQ